MSVKKVCQCRASNALRVCNALVGLLGTDHSRLQLLRFSSALNFAQGAPLLHFDGRIYTVSRFDIIAENDDHGLDEIGAQKRVGMNISQRFHDGVIRFGIRKI